MIKKVPWLQYHVSVKLSCQWVHIKAYYLQYFKTKMWKFIYEMQIYKSMRICTNMCTLCLGVQMDVYLQYKTKPKISQTKTEYKFNTPVYINIHIKWKKKEKQKHTHTQERVMYKTLDNHSQS